MKKMSSSNKNNDSLDLVNFSNPNTIRSCCSPSLSSLNVITVPSNRLEKHFSKHQKRFYKALLNGDKETLRPLFYARLVHSNFVLLAFFSFYEESNQKFLRKVFPFFIKGSPSERFSIYRKLLLSFHYIIFYVYLITRTWVKSKIFKRLFWHWFNRICPFCFKKSRVG